MGVNVRGRSFLTLLDFTSEEIRYFLELSAEFKRLKANGVDHSYLKGKQVVLLFERHLQEHVVHSKLVHVT